jgi:iron complex transport system ATP-binding protein
MFKAESLESGYVQGKNSYVLHGPMDFEVKPGTLLLLAGKNGAGKSTLMQILGGLTKPLSGSVTVNGTDIHKASVETRASLISQVFTHPPDMPLTTAKEVVFSSRLRFVSGWNGKIKEHEKELHNALEMCGMEAFAERQFNTLSDGEKQKVMIARALAQETPIILMDEPLAFLDYPGRREMLARMKKWCHEMGKTIIFSSHDLELALKSADAMLLLKENQKFRWEWDAEVLKSTDPAGLFSA